MIGLFLGIFLLVVCILMLLFAGGDIVGMVGVLFVVGIALWLIVTELNKKRRDRRTSKKGEKCYAKILDCARTGNFIGNKEEYKVVTVLYVSSMQKRIFQEETVGFNHPEKYPRNSYFHVLYYEDDINVCDRVDEKEIPQNILEVLNDKEVDKEYDEYVTKKMQEDAEKRNKEIEKAEKLAEKIYKFDRIYTIVAIYLFSLFTAFITSYFSKMFELLKNFSNNMPLSFIYPVVLIINLSLVVPIVSSPEESRKREIFALIWFFSMAFIMLQTAFFQ